MRVCSFFRAGNEEGQGSEREEEKEKGRRKEEKVVVGLK